MLSVAYYRVGVLVCAYMHRRVYMLYMCGSVPACMVVGISVPTIMTHVSLIMVMSRQLNECMCVYIVCHPLSICHVLSVHVWTTRVLDT